MVCYNLQALRSMTLSELAEAGGRLDLSFTKNHSKAKRVSMIIARQAKRAADSPPEIGDPPDPTVDGRDRPEFEALFDDAGDPPTASPRGGSRPGAGRPVGMTDEKARMNHLSETPHPVVEELVCAVYGGWAKMTGCPQVALDPDELKDNALALTNAGEYMGIVQKIPPWLKLAVTSVVVLVGTFRHKARVAREWRNSHRSAPDSERPASGGPADTGNVPA